MTHHDLINQIIELKIKSLPPIDVFNSIWYLERSYSKIPLITSTALSRLMISILSFFEYISHSSSLTLEETKLIAIVNWNFYDWFLSGMV